MPLDDYLSAKEIKALTRKTWKSSQQKELEHMGILHAVRIDGSLAVLREHVEMYLLRKQPVVHKTRNERVTSPNWEALNA